MRQLGFIIPAYNEAQRFPMEEVEAFLNDPNRFDPEIYKLIFVNDGSTDNTANILASLSDKFPQQVELINLEKNKGKAEAVRHAFLEKKNEYTLLGYLDCDLATPLSEFYTMGLDALKRNKKIYFGSRIQKLGSHIERKTMRHYLGRIFATLAGMILKTPIYDTQCGAKYFHNELIANIFEEEFISKWLFDIELIARLISKYGYDYFTENAFEAPLNQWLEKGGSKIKLSDTIQFPLELLRINKTYQRGLKKQRKNNAVS
jgi:glycosyltransferase involved in cell wall biosynthesis